MWGKLKITGLLNGQTTTESTHKLNISTVEKATVIVTLNDEIVEGKDNIYEIIKGGENFFYVSSTLNGEKSKEQIAVYFKPKKVILTELNYKFISERIILNYKQNYKKLILIFMVMKMIVFLMCMITG